jgi:hypothetical protein
MFDGQTLVVNNSTVYLFSPWFPRGGDFATFAAEVTVIGGTAAKLTISAYHKNADDQGDGTDVDAASNIQFTATGRLSTTWPVQTSSTAKGFKQLVRYRYKFESTGVAYITYRMMPPVWFDNVASY